MTAALRAQSPLDQGGSGRAKAGLGFPAPPREARSFPARLTLPLAPIPRFLSTWPQPPKLIENLPLAFFFKLTLQPLISLTGWVEKETYY